MSRPVVVMKKAAVLLLTAALTSTSAANASTAPWVGEPSSVVLKGAQQLDMRSASGRTYRVFISVPDKPAPDAGYGVLYVLDGNAMFLTAVEAVRAMERRPDVPRDIATIVVGIGYPDGADVGVERTYDLTPPGSGHPRIKAASGGADQFLAFLQDELKPYIATGRVLDSARQGLFGHSFGGLFVLHSLQREPEAFSHRIAASPSIWFDRQQLEPGLQQWASQRPQGSAPLRVLLTAGQYEQVASAHAYTRPNVARTVDTLKERQQVDGSRALAHVLDGAAGVSARFDEILGEDHGSVIPAAISRAVAYMLMPPIQVPPQPTARQYWEMTPEQRYDLRMWVRQLPDQQRIPWLTALRDTLQGGLDANQRQALHDERNRLDAAHGSAPHAVNAPPR